MEKISPLELEDSIVNLEYAEHLLNIFTEFIDEECPQIENKDFKKEGTAAVIYATRTPQFRTSIIAAFDYIRKAKNDLSKLVYHKTSA